jgi:hypothetical protein
MLYGASLMLEFVTLVVLRIREPELKREFRVPGGLPGAILVGLFPLGLLLLALVKSGSETVLGLNGLMFGALMIASGFAVYAATRRLRANRRSWIGRTDLTLLDTALRSDTTKQFRLAHSRLATSFSRFLIRATFSPNWVHYSGAQRPAAGRKANPMKTHSSRRPC